MPPKAKFTKAQIIHAALEIVREKGLENLTARALGEKLGSSACPIFTVFESMEAVQGAVLAKIKGIYKGYIEKGLAETPSFKGVGKHYILFAAQEPKLFQILFMRECAPASIDSVLPLIEESYEAILASITAGYGVEKKTAEKLYQHLWVYTHGIATLCATKMCRFTAEEINEMMTEVFTGLFKQIKEAERHD